MPKTKQQPRPVRSPDNELEEIMEGSTDAIMRSVLSIVDRFTRGFSMEDELEHYRDLIVKSMMLGDLLGRRRVLLEVDAMTGGAGEFSDERVHLDRYSFEDWATWEYATRITTIVPKVSFEQAIKNITDREPRLAADFEEVQRLYQGGDTFAIAKSSSEVLTRRVQDKVLAFLRNGKSTPKASEVISSLSDFSRAYSETVFRTNANTAYTRGRFEQSRKPGIRKALPAFEIIGPTDADARKNHKALVGFIALTNDRVWEELATPLGYNCRHNLRLVGVAELKRRGRMTADGGFIPMKRPAGGYPDRGFERKFLGGGI